VLDQADEQVGEHRLTTGPDAPPSGGGSALGLPISEEVARSSGRLSRFSPFRVVVLVVLVVAAVVAWELTRGSAPAYRTAAVGTGTAVQTLDAVATITPVNQANLNFNASGTVSAVNVSVGQRVTAGQTLASLDVTSLQAGVTSAQASLASAQATLASDEAAQSAQSSATTSSATTSGATASTPASDQSSSGAGRPSASATTTTTTPASSGKPTKPSQQITALQQTLVTDQHQEDLDASRATAALGQATTACESSTAPTSGSSSSRGSSGSAGSTATTTATTATATTATTCAGALSQASAAQAAVSADIKKVDKDESALTSALESSTGSGTPSGTGSGFPGKTGTTGGATTGSTTASTTATTIPVKTGSTGTASGSQKDTGSTVTSVGSSSTTSGGSGSQNKKVVTSQQLVVDQAAIDTAQADLSAAQQALDDVNLVSTIAGTVGSVSIAPADTVTAGGNSGNAAIVVIGSGSSYDVTTDVAVADVGKIAVGQQALVTPDATSSVVDGSVSAIGAVASSGTSVTYPVTIAIDAPDLGGLSGSQANVSIVVKRSVDVTTVPSSAVHTVGTIHYVTVIDKNTPKTVRVGLGTVGDTLTQVTSGVSKGEIVSLADLAQPVPSSSTNTTTGRFGGALGGAGGFGGGAGGAGGFGGGSFAGGGRTSGFGG
jgi:trimeric autotransporter adhesin